MQNKLIEPAGQPTTKCLTGDGLALISVTWQFYFSRRRGGSASRAYHYSRTSVYLTFHHGILCPFVLPKVCPACHPLGLLYCSLFNACKISERQVFINIEQGGIICMQPMTPFRLLSCCSTFGNEVLKKGLEGPLVQIDQFLQVFVNHIIVHPHVPQFILPQPR